MLREYQSQVVIKTVIGFWEIYTWFTIRQILLWHRDFCIMILKSKKHMTSCRCMQVLKQQVFQKHPNPVSDINMATALCSYRKQLGISEILKSNGPDFAQFWFKFDNLTFGWCKTVKRIQEKYFLQIFVINGSYISKKHE